MLFVVQLKNKMKIYVERYKKSIWPTARHLQVVISNNLHSDSMLMMIKNYVEDNN